MTGQATKSILNLDVFSTGSLDVAEKRTYLAVKSQEQQHDKEQDGPECWHWHHGHGFGVGNEGQARTWWEIEWGRGRKKGGEDGINISKSSLDLDD